MAWNGVGLGFLFSAWVFGFHCWHWRHLLWLCLILKLLAPVLQTGQLTVVKLSLSVLIFLIIVICQVESLRGWLELDVFPCVPIGGGCGDSQSRPSYVASAGTSCCKRRGHPSNFGRPQSCLHTGNAGRLPCFWRRWVQPCICRWFAPVDRPFANAARLKGHRGCSQWFALDQPASANAKANCAPSAANRLWLQGVVVQGNPSQGRNWSWSLSSMFSTDSGQEEEEAWPGLLAIRVLNWMSNTLNTTFWRSDVLTYWLLKVILCM